VSSVADLIVSNIEMAACIKKDLGKKKKTCVARPLACINGRVLCFKE
jgi:hypothetical protein